MSEEGDLHLLEQKAYMYPSHWGFLIPQMEESHCSSWVLLNVFPVEPIDQAFPLIFF